MALRQIVQDGDPILKKKCRPVTNFDAKLGQLLDDMHETLLEANGYGLAGPQVEMCIRDRPITCRPADLLEPEIEKLKVEAAKYVQQEEDVLKMCIRARCAGRWPGACA